MSYQTRKFNELSKAQVAAARQFAAEFGISVSQAAKWLDWLFAARNGKITAAQLEKDTGIRVPEAVLHPPVSDALERKSAHAEGMNILRDLLRDMEAEYAGKINEVDDDGDPTLDALYYVTRLSNLRTAIQKLEASLSE